MSETTFYFGKYGPKDGEPGKDLSEVPSGYLRWMVEKMDPVPLPQYRFNEDKTPMTAEQVDVFIERNRNFISAAEDELTERDET